MPLRCLECTVDHDTESLHFFLVLWKEKIYNNSLLFLRFCSNGTTVTIAIIVLNILYLGFIDIWKVQITPQQITAGHLMMLDDWGT